MEWPTMLDWIMMAGIGIVGYVSYCAGYKEAIRDIEKKQPLDNI